MAESASEATYSASSTRSTAAALAIDGRKPSFTTVSACSEPEPVAAWSRSSYRPPVTSYSNIRPLEAAVSKPAKIGTTTSPCMAEGRLALTIWPS